MTKVEKIIGIDISKEKFDVCFSLFEGEHRSATFTYHSKSLASFAKSIPQGVLCVMETTGVYHLRLAHFLYDKGILVSVVNPLSVKNFSRAVMARTKTDKADAWQLVRYASTMEVKLWQPPKECYTRIQQAYRTIELLQVQSTQFSNQLEAIDASVVIDSVTRRILTQQLNDTQRNIKKLEQHIEELAMQEDSAAVKNISSIPGIGKKTAIVLLAVTKGMDNFQNYRQLSSYFGLCPRIYDSGKSVHGKAHICKMGMSWVRKLLYICAWSAARHNSACRKMYIRLIEKGKPKKLALIALANKLLKQAFALVKNNSTYSQNFT